MTLQILLPNNTLIINRSDSRCNNCGLGAIPTEEKHDQAIGYSIRGFQAGCGIRWEYVTSNYVGMSEHVREMRPDLTPVGFLANDTDFS